MSREIEFRAWTDEGVCISPDYVGRDGLGHWKENSIPTSGPVEQYTGLKDRNGKKIFEGDILQSHGKDGRKGVVEFDCGVFGLNWDYGTKKKTMLGSWGARHNLRKLDDDMINHVEIVGNLHENSELMEAGE